MLRMYRWMQPARDKLKRVGQRAKALAQPHAHKMVMRPEVAKGEPLPRKPRGTDRRTKCQ